MNLGKSRVQVMQELPTEVLSSLFCHFALFPQIAHLQNKKAHARVHTLARGLSDKNRP